MTKQEFQQSISELLSEYIETLKDHIWDKAYDKGFEDGKEEGKRIEKNKTAQNVTKISVDIDDLELKQSIEKILTEKERKKAFYDREREYCKRREQAFDLFFNQGKTKKEIAVIMNTNVPSIDTLLCSARRLIKEREKYPIGTIMAKIFENRKHYRNYRHYIWACKNGEKCKPVELIPIENAQKVSITEILGRNITFGKDLQTGEIILLDGFPDFWEIITSDWRLKDNEYNGVIDGRDSDHGYGIKKPAASGDVAEGQGDSDASGV